MPRGGSRPGAGRPRRHRAAAEPAPKTKQASKTEPVTESVSHSVSVTAAPDPSPGAAVPHSPLTYMLGVMNDPDVPADRRDRMAVAAAPYVHPRLEKATLSKKEEAKNAARQAATGKFAPAPPPDRQTLN